MSQLITLLLFSSDSDTNLSGETNRTNMSHEREDCKSGPTAGFSCLLSVDFALCFGLLSCIHSKFNTTEDFSFVFQKEGGANFCTQLYNR